MQNLLSTLCTLDEKQLLQVRRCIDGMVDLKRTLAVPPPSKPSSSRPAATVKSTPVASAPPGKKNTLSALKMLPRIEPMRAPREGALRFFIHRALESAPQMTRAEVIEAVTPYTAHLRNPHLKEKIGDMLGNANDPFIQRVDRGVYRFVPQPNQEKAP